MRTEYHCSNHGQASTSASHQDLEGGAYSQTGSAKEACTGKAGEEVEITNAYMYRLALLLWSLTWLQPSPSEFPRLKIEAPPELATVRARLESIPASRFADIAEFLGATGADAAIQVLLATETSDLARGVAPWVSVFAV